MTQRTLRHPARPWALLLAAAFTLLPPGTWSLCFDGLGHVAIEPTAMPCGPAPGHAATNEGACATVTHEACEDILLLDGGLAPAPDPTPRDLAPVLVALIAGDLLPLPAAGSPHDNSPTRIHSPRPPGAPTVLRC
jgi:hypothetical protein